MAMASRSWLTSLECSTSTIPSSEGLSFLSVLKNWSEFIFLSPCSQRILFSSVDLLFLIVCLVLAVRKLCSRFFTEKNSSSDLDKPLLPEERSQLKVTPWFIASVAVTALLALSYIAICILAFTRGVQSPWNLAEAFFLLFQAVSHVVILVLVAHEKRFGAVTHPMVIRAYWAVSLIVVALFSATAITRMVTVVGENLDQEMRIDDIYSLVSLPFYVFLFIVAIRGSSGLTVVEDLRVETHDSVDADVNISGFASASLISKAMWLWMNPLLSKGYKSPLKMNEVPTLPPIFLAEKMAEQFEVNWRKSGENSKNRVIFTLIRCFWRHITFTGVLAVVRLLVTYVGPILIQTFVDFASGDRSNLAEGFYLVLILLVAKVVEVLSSHQFNFQTQRLGMLIRSSLITALYKKGLRLSCSARQAHGVGQIVNYMAVDCQQLSDMMPQMHALWLMPLQIGISLVLLYLYMGISMLVSLVAVFAVLIFTLVIARKNNFYQFNLMMSRDCRMKTTNELLNNMRVIKFQAWEEQFNKKILQFREKEYGWLSKFMYAISYNMALLWSVPVVIAALTFVVAILMHVPLGAGKVFTVTTILKILQEPIRTFPQSLMAVSQAIISLERLDGYLTSHELDTKTVEREEGCSDRIALQVKDGTFSWEDEGAEQVLKDVNFQIKKGELAAIVGTVGSGKSSLLAAVLGELKKISGKVRVCGSTAYVAQSSWIQNATIQDNILFGSPLNTKRYKEVIRACSLEKDLEIFEYGDQTEIGERGINLSGGQKQRIQLARAVYQDCDIYLLDDVFSAVDAHTGTEIFKECVRGALKHKTILLVTHQVDFLHNADLILVMRDGKIVQSGKYDELLQSGMDFGALVAAHESSVDLVERSANNSDERTQEIYSPRPLPITPKSPHSPKALTPISPVSGQGDPTDESWSLDESNSEKGNSKLIEDEERETGKVSLAVYKQYCTTAYGWWGIVAIVGSSLLWQLSLMAGDYWLAYETSGDTLFNPSLFIETYAAIAIVSCILVGIRMFFQTFIGLKIAQSFFSQILESILHAPMSFFDTTPSGRILTRASNDQFNIDILIPFFLSLTISMYFTVISILFITCQYAWPTIFLIIPLIWLNYWYRGYYLSSSRELSRLDSITKAPVIHHFSESISGVMTIRGFRKQEKFFQENFDRVNANLRMDFHNNGSNEWLGFRLEMIGSFLLCAATACMVLLPSTIIKPEYVGLSLSYGLPLNAVLFWTVYMSCLVENRMVSVERIKQFITIPSEAPWRNKEYVPPSNWPSHGDIEVTNLQVRYRTNTPLVLKGIYLRIHGGERIGVVGRTGSGKSTLIQVFFRLVEPANGKIFIDGINICQLGLHDLRSRFGIIPQEPVLFEGTIRSNIDPIGLYSDDEIWKSLERCQLKDVVAAKPEKLDASVADCGDNWSVGQRQLLCLGRVLLKQSKILFMDEATASVDSQTDAVIQKIIREDFSACTIITIAHRIPTVIDCDRVLVVDDGWVKEFDRPSKLLERRSLFGALVQEYSNRSSGL
ncbi:ABC transporter C family member 4-like [Coffea eugenioides]|uniref:ABC transporter C family member 4-like n=1 Tax=Coffea eugenioides TaxID=49369 RepID=UPI000F6097C0|nr:ABC transporter C family member 4-like [Coffea eugenioides]XP_027165595.1 ABC transporter C family member 4-like [Coffea eugenioides]